jgi:uncharacterized protein (TIGR02996 family)
MTATQPVTGTLAALLAAVEADPLDRAPRLVLADYVEIEMGSEYGGLLRTKRPASRSGQASVWYWQSSTVDARARTWTEKRAALYPDMFGDFTFELPDPVFAELSNKRKPVNEFDPRHLFYRVRYKSPRNAFADLARAVVRAAREARP